MTQKMIHLGSVLLVAILLAALAPAARAQALLPCSITAIDARAGIVSAKVNASGAAFQFRVTDAKLLVGLHVGQGVYANFTTKQVSLDGKRMCCEITSPPQAPALPAAPATAPKPVSPPPASAPVGKPAPAAPAAAPMAAGQIQNRPTPLNPNSGSSTTSGNTNPQPVSFSCGGTANPLSADTCSKSAAIATNFGITVTCGASITITGTIFQAGIDDWLVFSVPPSRANCADYSGRTQSTPIQASISSTPGGAICFDVLQTAGGPAVPASYGPFPAGTTGVATCIPVVVGLGLNNSPLQPGQYFIRVSSTGSATGAWTLTLKG